MLLGLVNMNVYDLKHVLTAVLLVAAVGGLGTGLVATALGGLIGLWLFVEPRDRLSSGRPDELLGLSA